MGRGLTNVGTVSRAIRPSSGHRLASSVNGSLSPWGSGGDFGLNGRS